MRSIPTCRRAGSIASWASSSRRPTSTSTSARPAPPLDQPWHPSPKDCDHPQLDVADLHFYLRAVKDQKYRDEADAAVGNAGWLRGRAKNKPA